MRVAKRYVTDRNVERRSLGYRAAQIFWPDRENFRRSAGVMRPESNLQVAPAIRWSNFWAGYALGALSVLWIIDLITRFR